MSENADQAEQKELQMPHLPLPPLLGVNPEIEDWLWACSTCRLVFPNTHIDTTTKNPTCTICGKDVIRIQEHKSGSPMPTSLPLLQILSIMTLKIEELTNELKTKNDIEVMRFTFNKALDQAKASIKSEMAGLVSEIKDRRKESHDAGRKEEGENPTTR